ncbi:large conductance mechanosensitive channel protein MscL [Cellulomonas humilata]|uniref:Large-conductance mechanosensitive channel n=1 Tax=Cellulomonas humilata TaxID=144055 RepID=A0A7Y6A1F8_9CELL|nr:large conductance mechanosensitive channel protein MscL [Cellulomonas humilata]NUU16907.1 large conductance mechanosensitive channel protein MscL [Cellulomonas humilata]
MLQGFKDFISRGNAIELAVGVVIGAAFGQVVAALVDGFIGPLIAAILGQTDLSSVWTFSINNAVFSLGLILQALILFLFTAAAVYFFIVVPMNALAARRKRGEEAEPEAPAEDILVLQEIRDLLARNLTPAIVNDAGTGATTTPPPSIPPAV